MAEASALTEYAQSHPNGFSARKQGTGLSKKPGTTGKKHAGGTKHHGGSKKAKGPTKHFPQHQVSGTGSMGGQMGPPKHQHQVSSQHPMHGGKVTGSGRIGAALVAGDVRCCSVQALAASLRVSGLYVSDQDALALYFLTTNDPGFGCGDMRIVLAAATKFSIGGIRPLSWARITLKDMLPGDIQVWQNLDGEEHAVTLTREGLFSWSEHWTPDNWGAIWPGTLIENWTVRWPQ